MLNNFSDTPVSLFLLRFYILTKISLQSGNRNLFSTCCIYSPNQNFINWSCRMNWLEGWKTTTPKSWWFSNHGDFMNSFENSTLIKVHKQAASLSKGFVGSRHWNLIQEDWTNELPAQTTSNLMILDKHHYKTHEQKCKFPPTWVQNSWLIAKHSELKNQSTFSLPAGRRAGTMIRCLTTFVSTSTFPVEKHKK